VDSHLNQINSQLKSLETDLKSFENSIKDLNLINKQIEQKFKELENKKAELKAYEEQFVWSKYKGKTFEDIAEMEKADNALQQEINGLRKEADKVVGDLNRYTVALNGIKDTIKSIDIEIATAEGKIGQLNQEIDSDLKAKYADYEENRLNEICEKLNQEIEKRNQELAERNQELEKQNKEIIEAKTVRENYVKNIEGYSLELQKYEEELKGLLIECGFDNLERVKEVLNKKLDVAFLRKKIEHFNWQKQTNAQRLKELNPSISF
jgi:chromosome segregation ATPase